MPRCAILMFPAFFRYDCLLRAIEEVRTNSSSYYALNQTRVNVNAVRVQLLLRCWRYRNFLLYPKMQQKLILHPLAILYMAYYFCGSASPIFCALHKETGSNDRYPDIQSFHVYYYNTFISFTELIFSPIRYLFIVQGY